MTAQAKRTRNGTYAHVNAHMATWHGIPCPDTASHPPIVDRDGFINAKTACRDDAIRGYEAIYGVELTRDEKAVLLERWAAEDEPVLRLVSDRPVDPGTFALPPGVTGELPPDEAIKQGVDTLMGEDDPPEEEPEPDDPALDKAEDEVGDE